ncbi:hypothetical protein SODG_006239 [Sodalis praecaptivus]
MAISKIGTLTIGQAPRPDIAPLLDAALPPQVACIHAGLLDGLDDEAIAACFAVQPGGAVLTSRLLDGRAVVMDKAAVGTAVQEKIHALDAQGCDIIALLCTGEFHGLTTQRAWLMEPDLILLATQTASVGQRRAGILVPLASQIDSEKRSGVVWRSRRCSRWPRLIPPPKGGGRRGALAGAAGRRGYFDRLYGLHRLAQRHLRA